MSGTRCECLSGCATKPVSLKELMKLRVKQTLTHYFGVRLRIIWWSDSIPDNCIANFAFRCNPIYFCMWMSLRLLQRSLFQLILSMEQPAREIHAQVVEHSTNTRTLTVFLKEIPSDKYDSFFASSMDIKCLTQRHNVLLGVKLIN